MLGEKNLDYISKGKKNENKHSSPINSTSPTLSRKEKRVN